MALLYGGLPSKNARVRARAVPKADWTFATPDPHDNAEVLLYSYLDASGALPGRNRHGVQGARLNLLCLF